MKEITYSEFEDYLAKADAYDDPKTIKIYGDGFCLTFLRTHLIQWRGGLTKEMLEKLREHGHCRAVIEDVVSVGRL